ncbi:unnamed protein product [Trypanosoma congolense IL3000]|uniref:WGS project CAEQ00000000 data, annotated contig 823 n=1 Tax=Trypanosoma congolense (strain IL3000) TaxID=1068625 RepID=F9WIQ9_TRYCI|nr:unnamed protein product [Trypanosoma congolense IL3000]
MGKRLKKREREREEIVEDLDLDVEDYDVDDDDVVHNRRRKTKGDLDDVGGVLPSEAHKLEGFDDDDDERGAHIEEERLALEVNRSMRRSTVDTDFDVGGIAAHDKRKRAAGINTSQSVAPVIEAVERDYAALTSSERLAIVQKESPEMIKMLDEMKQYLVEVKELARPLQELLFKKRLSGADKNLVQFLETKVQLMLSYCMHVTFYLLLKAEGKKVADHPVIDNLVEIRVYLEKLLQLEEKLQYSLNRLLSGKYTAAARLDTLRPLQHSERAPTTVNKEAKKSRKQLEAMREADEIEKEEVAAMNRIRSKKSSELDTTAPIDRKAASAILSYHEDEDQFFSKLVAEDSEDEDGDQGLSLVERLRKRQCALAKDKSNSGNDNKGGEVVVDDGDSCYEEESEEDDLLSEGADEEGEYEMLLEEERERKKAVTEAQPKREFVEPVVDRRKTTKKIETHRGLTKSRPKDRKTPRTAQRRKYEKGMRIHKAQVRTVQPEPEGGFVGVPSLKTSVTKSIRF